MNLFMTYRDILNSGANVSITIGAEDLKEVMRSMIADVRNELENTIRADKTETYPSPKQVSEILDVDASTLWRWSKRGYLVPVEIGGKRRYKMSEVKALLNGRRN